MAEDKRLAHNIRPDSAMLVVVDIGATNAYSLDLNQYVSRPWRGNRAFLYTNIMGCIEHCGLIFHLFNSFIINRR